MLVQLIKETGSPSTYKLMNRLHDVLHRSLVTLLLGAQVVYFRPADILQQSMIKHVPLADRLAFQSAANEALTTLLRLASQHAGCHIESVVQVCFPSLHEIQGDCIL